MNRKRIMQGAFIRALLAGMAMLSAGLACDPPLWQQPEVVTPTVTQYLHDLGYTTGAILKNSREINNVRDVRYSELPFGVGFHDRNPVSFYQRTRAFIAMARKKGKPFFLYANPIDPHRPWVDTEQEREMQARWNPERRCPPTSLSYSPGEVEVPHFLPDLPEIRKNLVPYCESPHRGDECIGGILQALEESGAAPNTIVFFISDHGMAAIGGKATLYHDGLRTPMIVRWPGVMEGGRVDEQSIISSIDIVPTLLDAAGIPSIEGIEGRHPELSGKVASIIDKPVEELIDLTDDPGCWKNLVNSPEHQEVLILYRQRLRQEMESSNDPELAIFDY